MGRVEGKVILVTGAASGIGACCAETLAREGAKVIVTDVQDNKGAELVAAIGKAGGRARYVHHDVTQEVEWQRVLADVEKTEGRLDVLVNNAGICLASPSITTMSLEDFRRQQSVNVDSVFLGLKHVLPLMRRLGKGGSIVNLSSVAGLKGIASMSAYSATKGAVRLLTKAVAMECANTKDGIRINSVHPGAIETPMWLPVGAALGRGVINLDEVSKTGVPLGVKGVPQDIANGVLWLASDESRYVTGMEMVIDGGQMLL